jgi:NADPH-dependent 2,4-dienoyl-CoA reductase/sulfur reductase-like enzyme
MKTYDLIVIGGGPAGMAAAISARENGCEDVLILERGSSLGGILNQCIHNGFGLLTFHEELTGPEYAARYAEKICALNIDYQLNTTVIRIDREKKVTAINADKGLQILQSKTIILAMGCRERPRGALNIPGSRPAGIFSAGTAQRIINIDGYMPGHNVVILGSGDIGLIMARRMTLEGAKVKVVAELMPYSSGLKRNIVQCLDDFGIPLKFQTSVVKIHGDKRLTGVTLARMDDRNKPIPDTEEFYECDTLLLSVGLIPENELSDEAGIPLDPSTCGPVVNNDFETEAEGIFACGNVLHVHDLVDFVSQEAVSAGKNAACYIRRNGLSNKERTVRLFGSDGVRYTVPQILNPDRMDEDLTVRFRVGEVYQNAFISVFFNDQCILRRKKPIVTPGEMELIKLRKEQINQFPDLKSITIKIEKG